ncbi:MAG: hypothetical protein ABIH66_06720 [bacterium]
MKNLLNKSWRFLANLGTVFGGLYAIYLIIAALIKNYPKIRGYLISNYGSVYNYLSIKIEISILFSVFLCFLFAIFGMIVLYVITNKEKVLPFLKKLIVVFFKLVYEDIYKSFWFMRLLEGFVDKWKNISVEDYKDNKSTPKRKSSIFKTSQELEFKTSGGNEKTRLINDEDVVKQLCTLNFLNKDEIVNNKNKFQKQLTDSKIIYKGQLENFTKNKKVENIIRSLYKIFHDREPDTMGYIAWGSLIYNRRCDDEVINIIARSAVQSPEYNRKNYSSERTSAKLKEFEGAVKAIKQIFSENDN